MRIINGNIMGGNGMSGFESRVKAGVAFTFVLTVAIMIAIVCGVVYGCNQIRDKGLKGVVESVWEGDTNSTSTTSVGGVGVSTN